MVGGNGYDPSAAARQRQYTRSRGPNPQDTYNMIASAYDPKEAFRAWATATEKGDVPKGLLDSVNVAMNNADPVVKDRIMGRGLFAPDPRQESQAAAFAKKWTDRWNRQSENSLSQLTQ